jgi:hypothetical protein
MNWKLKVSFFCVSTLASAYYINQGSAIASEYLSNRWASLRSQYQSVRVVERVIPAREKTLDEIISDASRKHHIPEILISALIVQESGKGLRADRMRYEPRLQARFKREPWMNDTEYQALATSWGYGQIIYGIWRDFCGLDSYADLLDPEKNIHCSARILRDCMDRRSSIKPLPDRFKRCLSEYNGDGTGAYAQSVINHLAELTLLTELRGYDK